MNADANVEVESPPKDLEVPWLEHDNNVAAVPAPVYVAYDSESGGLSSFQHETSCYPCVRAFPECLSTSLICNNDQCSQCFKRIYHHTNRCKRSPPCANEYAYSQLLIFLVPELFLMPCFVKVMI